MLDQRMVDKFEATREAATGDTKEKMLAIEAADKKLRLEFQGQYVAFIETSDGNQVERKVVLHSTDSAEFHSQLQGIPELDSAVVRFVYPAHKAA